MRGSSLEPEKHRNNHLVVEQLTRRMLLTVQLFKTLRKYSKHAEEVTEPRMSKEKKNDTDEVTYRSVGTCEAAEGVVVDVQE